MALQVWLPLTGHLENQGLSDITVNNNGATVDNAGKLGQCYYFNGAYLRCTINPTEWTEFSFALWTKFPDPTAGNKQLLAIGTSSGWANIRAGLLYKTNASQLIFSISNGSSSVGYNFSIAITPNEWQHIVAIYKDHVMSLYLNGELKSTHTVTYAPKFSDISTFGVGAASNGAEKYTGYLNDIRIYDHALSAKEVHLLSQGLVCHYPLDNNGNGGDNIIPDTSPNEVQYTYPSSSYSDKFSKTSTIVPSASQYILSFWAKSTNSGDKVRAHWYSPNTTTGAETSQGATSAASDGRIDFTLSDQWKKYWCVWTQSSTTTVKHLIFPRMFSQASGQATGTGTVSVKCVKLEEGNQPTAWCPNSADPLYSSLSYNSTLIYDCSGYNYHGTKTGDLTVSSDTSRYSLSTHFNGTSYSYLTSPSAEVKTISFWAKWDSIPSGQSILFVDYKSRLGFGLMSKGILCGSVTGTYYTFSKSSIVANTWYHFVVINPDNSTRKLYINGVEQTATTSMDVWSYNIDQLQIGKRSTSSDGFVGNMSDFRAYATALSAEDIQQLYNAPVSVSNNGAMFIQGEFIES